MRGVCSQKGVGLVTLLKSLEGSLSSFLSLPARTLAVPLGSPKHLLEVGVGRRCLLGVLSLLGGAAALSRQPGLGREGGAWLGGLARGGAPRSPGQLRRARGPLRLGGPGLGAQRLLALWGEPLLGGASRSGGLRRLSLARAPCG